MSYFNPISIRHRKNGQGGKLDSKRICAGSTSHTCWLWRHTPCGHQTRDEKPMGSITSSQSSSDSLTAWSRKYLEMEALERRNLWIWIEKKKMKKKKRRMVWQNWAFYQRNFLLRMTTLWLKTCVYKFLNLSCFIL